MNAAGTPGGSDCVGSRAAVTPGRTFAMVTFHFVHPTLVRCMVAGSLALALTATGIAAAQPPYDGIVVFGTSLSDSGNAFALRGGVNTPPDYLVDPLLIPAAPYAKGGHHFTNGATWIEQFARSRGLAGTVRPAFRGSSAAATNYAVAAARAYDDGTNVNLSAQVDAFLEATGGVAAPGALYVIEMGGNDVRDALAAYPSGGHMGVIQQALASIAANIGRLHGAGARNFLVWSAPNPALTPAIRYLDTIAPGTAQLATGLTVAFNGHLASIVAQWSAAPGIRMARLDAFALLNEIVADGSRFGLTDVTTACLTPYEQPYACTNPDEFLFWDGIHPTAAVHGIIAQRVASVLDR
jgi:phospholipase/lecithinase/hemolysin